MVLPLFWPLQSSRLVKVLIVRRDGIGRDIAVGEQFGTGEAEVG